MDFEVIETDKLGGKWRQEFAVIRNNVVFLRGVGDGQIYRVMTATVGNDVRGWRLCQDKKRLWEAASRLAKTHNLIGEVRDDTMGRKFIALFEMMPDNSETKETFTKFFESQMIEFFSIYDSLDIESD